MNQPCRNLWYAVAMKMWIVAAMVFTTASTAQGQSMLQVSPASLTFSAEVGEAPPPQLLMVTTSDGTRVPYIATSLTTSGGNWLSGTVFGFTPGNLGISVNPTGLAVGTYFGTYTVTSSSAANSPLTVPVTLNVVADNDPIVVDANQTPCITTDSAHHFTTVQSAVNSGITFSGATIHVCPGTYPEQITINKSLTLTGVTNPNANTGAAVIVPPTSGVTFNGNVFQRLLGRFTPAGVAVQVLLQAANVNLNNLAVDGAGAITDCVAGPSLIGVGYGPGSSGSLRRVAVRNQYVPVLTGGYCGFGLGVGVGSLSGNLTVLDSSIRGFSDGGFVSSGSSVIKTTVFSPSPSSINGTFCVFQEGNPLSFTLQLSSNTISNCSSGVTLDHLQPGSTATVSGNTIVNAAVGIHAFESFGTLEAVGNTIAGGNYGIYLDANGGGGNTIQYNDISAPGFAGILLLTGNNNVAYNTINDASVGVFGVTGNTVSNNTFLNVTTLTQ
jgi:hypothetical protein